MRAEYYAKCGPGKRPKFAAFDLETSGLGGGVLAASWIVEGETAAHYISGGDIVQELFYEMCERNEYQWFAHNAQYDWRYFVDRMIEYKDDLKIFSRSDSDIFMLTIDLADAYGPGTKLVMRDSLALFPATLKQFSEQFSPNEAKLDIDFEKVSFDPGNSDHIAYAKRDVVALLVSLIRFDGLLYDAYDVHIRATISSTAVAAWQRTLVDEKYYNDRTSEDFVRRAYYGGYVYLSSTSEHHNARTYDLNSSYPYQMETYEFPYGRPVSTWRFDHETLSVLSVRVSAPSDCVAPILPARSKHGLVWRTGVFDTVCTSVELAFAMDHGYELLKIYGGYVYPGKVSPFKFFIDKCKQLRSLYRGSPMEKVAKLIQNSVPGKFGSSRTRRKFFGSLPTDELEGVEMWGEFFVKNVENVSLQCMPHWAVFVTAYARLHLLREIYRLGPANVLYADTDSLTLQSGIELMTSDLYGGWKLEKEWRTFRARSPKVYAGLTYDGVIRGAAKGMPRRTWERDGVLKMVLDNRPREETVVHYRQLKRFVNVLKEPDYVGEIEAHRHLSSLDGSLSWRADADGSVRPRSWQDPDAADL